MTIKDKENKAPEVDLFGEVDKELKESIISTNKLKKTELRKLESDRAALIKKEAIKKQKRHINKELMSLAKVRLESLQSSELKELKKLNVEVTPKDLIQVMTFLAFSRGLYIAKEDVIKSFDNQCNFLHEVEFAPSMVSGYLVGILDLEFQIDNKNWKMLPFDPFRNLYEAYYYVGGMGLELEPDIEIKAYLNNELDTFQIYNLQVEIFTKIFNMLDFVFCYRRGRGDVNAGTQSDERLNVPKQRAGIKKMLKIGQIFYPHEFKKILNAGTQYLDDRNGPNIVASDQNGVLHFKLLNRPRVDKAFLAYFSRENTIEDYFGGGLISEACGAFTDKTPKNLHGFFDLTFSEDPSQRISSHRYYEIEDESEYNHFALANAWNEGLFGPFEYLITEEFVSFKWKYPKFFKLDSIADIEADHTSLFWKILNHEPE